MGRTVNTHAAANLHLRNGGAIEAEYFPPDEAKEFITLGTADPVTADVIVWHNQHIAARIDTEMRGTVYMTVEQAEQAIEQLAAAVAEAKAVDHAA